jgi:hypothetical protein
MEHAGFAERVSKLDGVSSIRLKKYVFGFFRKAGFGGVSACQIGSFDLAGLILKIVECWIPGRKVKSEDDVLIGLGAGREPRSYFYCSHNAKFFGR